MLYNHLFFFLTTEGAGISQWFIQFWLKSLNLLLQAFHQKNSSSTSLHTTQFILRMRS